MKTDRRNFIKVAGAGMITGAMTSCSSPGSKPVIADLSARKHRQLFNMSGFAAPPLKTVRVGYIGIGSRGLSSVGRMRLIEGVEI